MPDVFATRQAEHQTPEDNVIKFSTPVRPVACDLPRDPELVQRTSRPLCTTSVNIERRRKYAEKKLVETAKASGDLSMLARAIQTTTGKKEMPELANAVLGSALHFEQLKTNTQKLFNTCGRTFKRDTSHLMVEGLPASFLRAELKMKKGEIDYARRTKENDSGARDRFGRQTIDNGISKQNYANGVARYKVSEIEEILLKKFFTNSPYIASGADTMTRILGKNKTQWEEELFGSYPKLLRELAREYPQAVADPRMTGTLTMFQANMLAAIAQSKEQDFNQDVEIEKRQNKWTKHYARKLLRKAGELCKETKAERAIREAVDQKRSDMRKGVIQFDPLGYEVIGLGMRPFGAYLKRANLRYTTFSTPHPCPLCQDGESWTLQHEELTRMKAKAGLEGEVFSAKKSKHLNDLETKVKNYKLHKAQLEVCRAEVKSLEDGLLPGQAIVIRDYVNHHDHSGGHVKCLHWVVMWRTKINGNLQHLKLRHYCSDKDSCMTDAYYTADVMRFHFEPKSKYNPGLFDDFKKVYFVGDHGPHFSCSSTVFNESKSFHVYGKEVVLKFFASYHAFGRADGAGAEDSVSSRQDNKNGLQRNGAEAWTNMTNESNDQRSWAYHMAAVRSRM